MLNNPWMIGIGGGILSGLIVTFISRLLLSRRDQREYAQKILGANREVVYAVRPGISEGLVPTVDVLDALVEATARKYGVDRKDLYHPFEIAQELMKEVMDSSFISAQTKEDYCTRLGTLAKPTSLTQLEFRVADWVELPRPAGVEEYRSRMVSMMSLMMGLLAAAMTMFVALFSDGLFPGLAGDSRERVTTLLLPALLTLLVAALSMLLMSFIRRDRSGKLKRDIEKKTTSQGENAPDAP